MEVVLASKSPRRLQLLQAAGFAVEVRPSHIDEAPLVGERVDKMVQRLCRLKAEACPVDDCPVIAADTLVAVGGKVLGQPVDISEAKTMLQQLSGREHQVFTAVCVRLGQNILDGVAETRVQFRNIDDHELDVYLEHNEVLDKAGAYAIQAGAASFIQAVEGAMDNVMGLPVALTRGLLMKLQRERAE